MRRHLVAACCVLAGSSFASAMQVPLDRRAIEEAVFLGQSRFDTERDRLHASYRLVVARAPVDWIDVITPYYRVALAAEARARLGDRTFGQREAQAALNEAPNLIELLIEMTFHPLNTYVGVPAYDITLSGPQGVRVKPVHINRYPRFGPRTETKAPAPPAPNAAPILGNGQSMLGGTAVVQFNTADVLPSGRYDIVIVETGKELARVPMDLGKMR